MSIQFSSNSLHREANAISQQSPFQKIQGNLGKEDVRLAKKVDAFAPLIIGALGMLFIIGVVGSFEAVLITALILSPIFIIPLLFDSTDFPLSMPRRVGGVPASSAPPTGGLHAVVGARRTGGGVPASTTPPGGDPHAVVGARRTGGGVPATTTPPGGDPHAVVGARRTGGGTPASTTPTTSDTHATVGGRRTRTN